MKNSWAGPFANLFGGKGELPTAKTVLVPLVGSTMDESALKVAGEVARESSGRVHVLYIIEVPRAVPLDDPMREQVLNGERILRDVEDHWPHKKTSVATELLQARQAGPAIVTEVVERGADLVIMGIDHERRYGDYSLGSTTAHVLQHVPSRVWLLRAPINQNGVR
ncbi:MAG: universal stress protein [Dehalococcoidia bacterium]|nr:universal stress protein [Dehalococcoidia bacterium]